MESRADLSENIGLCVARFSVLRFPHRDKERFVTTVQRTLREQLAKLTANVPGLRVAVRFRTEEWRKDVIAYAGGEPWQGAKPDQAPQADARRGVRRSMPSYAAYREADADASRAIEADDVPAMLALLDDLRLAPPPASEVRRSSRMNIPRACVHSPSRSSGQ